MAPEVLGNRKYTEKADVFSFGIVVWEIFTGQCPYEGMTRIQVALGVLNNDLRPSFPRFIREGSEGNATSNHRPLLFRCRTCKVHFGDNDYYENTLVRHPHACEELENSGKGHGDMSIAYGLEQADDIFLTKWIGTILGPAGTCHDGRIYSLRIHCSDQYPHMPPEVQFTSRINMGCVDPQSGRVVSASCDLLSSSNRN
ncbi:hypothetical protein PsorP6_000661 [Peronosclerospora sorghi]|uniref:Uncharacterized protein n=1 Tax=Peronosclerospora sorghi TaxID=230839 RepID=A0ACC0WWX9_9STRA|nr:hypothetical protein PsorP6_000661 [Peronosclerospora sorghi]